MVYLCKIDHQVESLLERIVHALQGGVGEGGLALRPLPHSGPPPSPSGRKGSGRDGGGVVAVGADKGRKRAAKATAGGAGFAQAQLGCRRHRRRTISAAAR